MIFQKTDSLRIVWILALLLGSVFLATLLLFASALLPNQKENLLYNSNVYLEEENSKKLALTFDDGPHTSRTLPIVETLEKTQTPATFFFIGDRVRTYPEIVQNVQDAGHEIGLHSFTHSPKTHDTKLRLSSELESTRIAIESITELETILYRPPFLLDIAGSVQYNPDIHLEDSPVQWTYQYGYIPVGVDVDSDDWNDNTPGVIREKLDQQIADGGKIILLHDHLSKELVESGGLTQFIQDYEKDGYEFVTVSNILGVKSVEKPLGFVSRIQNNILAAIMHGLLVLADASNEILLVLLAILIARVVIVLYLKDLKPKNRVTRPWTDGISVLIPAYNEEQNIQATIRSVIDNKVKKQIIIINDGSTDRTLRKVKQLKKKYMNEDIVVVNTKNGGKASALNIAIEKVRYDVFAAIDADTIIEKDCLEEISKHFHDKNVGAVAGKINVATSKKLVTYFQKIEYLSGQNIEKKAFGYFGAIGIVPGAVGAWRTSLVKDCDCYSKQTLVEDQDLTFAVLASGKKIIYEECGVAFTEVPNSLGNFVKQRVRWVYGTMQCLWKYKSFMFRLDRKVFGFIVIPNSAMFNIFLPLLFPFIDIAAIILLFIGGLSVVIKSYLLFTVIDLLYTIHALKKEPKEDWWLLLLTPLQRLYYRPVMYYVVIKSFIRALRGTGGSWQKLSRTGSAEELYNKIAHENTKRIGSEA